MCRWGRGAVSAARRNMSDDLDLPLRQTVWTLSRACGLRFPVHAFEELPGPPEHEHRAGLLREPHQALACGPGFLPIVRLGALEQGLGEEEEVPLKEVPTAGLLVQCHRPPEKLDALLRETGCPRAEACDVVY